MCKVNCCNKNSEVQRVANETLERSVWKRIKDRISALYASGALQSNNETEVRRIIKDVFTEYNKADATEEERDRAYQSLAELLILSGIAQPSTLSDWSVDRVREAEDALGITSFQDLERTVGEWITVSRGTHTSEERIQFRHLHIGPGDGRLMYYLRKGRIDRDSPKPSNHELAQDTMFVGTPLEKPRTEYWEEIGLGDRLYFSIERLLGKFLRPDRKDDPQTRAVLRVLSTGLQHALRAHWFTEVQETEMMAPKLLSKKTVDLNDIIRFLAKPDSWITEDSDLFARGKCLASREFEKDSVMDLEVGSDEWLLQYVGWGDKTIHEAVWNRKFAFLKLGTQEIHNIRKEINSSPHSKKEYREEVCHLLKRFGLKVNAPTSEEDVKRALKDAENEIRRKKVLYRGKQRTEGAQDSTDQVPESLAGSEDHRKGRSPIDCLGDYFDERFMDGLRNHEVYEDSEYRRTKHPIDLNKAGPEMYMKNFVPGRFQQIRALFPLEGSFTMSTAERADSHLSNREYEELMANKLHLLQEGGVELSDGVRQSGSRVYRFREIQSAIEKSEGEFRCEVVVNGSTHEPVSVLIQKKLKNGNNDGFLPEEEKSKFLKTGHYLVPLSDVVERRPDLEILNEIRRRIIELAAGNLTIFQQLHHVLIKSLHKRLIQAATARNAKFLSIVDNELVEQIRIFLLQRNDQSLGTRLNTMLPFDGSDPEDTFFDLRRKLMSLFIASQEGRVRRTYDDALERFLSRGVQNTLNPVAASKPMEDGEQKDFDSEMLTQGRNSDLVGKSYFYSPVLSTRDIQQITLEVGDDVRALVLQRPERSQDITVISGLEMLSPNEIHTLPRRGLVDSTHNRHRKMALSAIPDNSEFVTVPAILRQTKKVETIRANLNKLRNRNDSPPIILITFADCGTNGCLRERLNGIVGNNSGLMYEWNIAFDRKTKDPSKLIRHLEQSKMQILSNRLDDTFGSIFIIGGSWFDADDQFGKFYKDHIGSLIMKGMLRKNSHHRMFTICFGEQTTADLIGQEFQMPHIVTMPGAMEFYPGPIQVTDTSHALFRDCPHRMTMMQTHSGHVLGLENAVQNMIIQPIARSGTTGNVTAYDALDGRIIGLQPHPEVRVMGLDDRTKLIAELKGFNDSLERRYGAGAGFFNEMWEKAAHRVRGEAGYEVILNALLHHTSALLGRPKR